MNEALKTVVRTLNLPLKNFFKKKVREGVSILELFTLP